MSENADLAKVRRDNPDGFMEIIITARMTTNTAGPTSGTEAVGSRPRNGVAVWVNEGGAGGEVVR